MKISSIADFLKTIEELQHQHPNEVLYFRGESRDIWPLRPSIMREGLATFESEMLTELITRRPDEFSRRDLAISDWVLAQHHGLQTRFLDVTRNPLVALFHACIRAFDETARLHIFTIRRELIKPFNSDSVSIIANFAKLPHLEQNMLLSTIAAQAELEYITALRRLYQLIRGEKPYFEERIAIGDLFRVFVIEPQQSSERIRAQSGAFLASAYHQRFEREEVLRLNDGIPVYAHYTATDPADSKETILRELGLLNITRESLFPGLDESAEAITEAYRQRLIDADSTAYSSE